MSLTDHPRPTPTTDTAAVPLTIHLRRAEPARQALTLLRTGFTVAPIAFGVDKFADRLVDWRTYLAPAIDRHVPGNAHQAMLAVGLIEIVAGLVVALRPREGGYLVAAWLGGIIVNLLLLGGHGDIVLRDVGLLVGALALARLASADTGRPPVTTEGAR